MTSLYARRGKRLLDLAVAAPALALLAPVMLLVALAIRWSMGRPVLFRQERPGRDERTFRLVKFRTMLAAVDRNGLDLPDSARITKLGRLLRRTSLDELPTLLNVVRGDMSLVGPRPLLVRYLPFFRKVERERFLVRPGITGLAQINGRNTVDWDDRLAWDVRYVRTLSLAADIRILALTLLRVFRGSGVVPVANDLLLDLDEQRRGTATSAGPLRNSEPSVPAAPAQYPGGPGSS